MKFIIALALFAVAAHGLKPRHIEIPAWKMFPKHTGAEWAAILANQEHKPEVVANFKPGTTLQPANAGVVTVDPAIINGDLAVSGQFPWQVSVTMNSASFCGGSLISDIWVLTAGHCVRNVDTFDLVFGSLTPNGGASGTVSRASTVSILHENYGPITIANDIGLVKLTTAVPLNTQISAVALPPRSFIGTSFAGETAIVSGWGKTSDSSSVARNLYFADLPIITNAQCAQTYGTTIQSTNICASTTDGKSTCNGDSGGPLVWQQSNGIWMEIGIVSFGSSSGCEAGFDVGFTRVTEYLNWIQTNTGIIT